MKMTIRKIAELTGVSRGTVDKVLHGRPGVSDEVRKKVQDAIDQLAYRPNRAAGALGKAHSPKRVAVLIPRQTNPYFAKMKCGVDSAYERLRDYGLSVDYFFCDVTNIREVLSILDYIAENGADGLIIRGTRSERLRNRLNRFHEQNVPVLLVDSDVPGVRRLCLVGEDCVRSGRLAASLLAKSIGGHGQVAVVGGSDEVSAHKWRIQGFREAVQEKYPDIQIVSVIQSLEQSVIAYEKTASLLRDFESLRGIFSVAGCTGDVGQAILDSQRDVKLVSYNFTPDIVALVQKGIVEFTIGLAPYTQGTLALETLAQYLLSGKKPSSTFLKTPISIGVDENIDLYEQEI